MDQRGGNSTQPVQERAKRLTSAEKSKRYRLKKAEKRKRQVKSADKLRKYRQKIAEK